MSKKDEFASVWDALEDDPVRVENLKLRSALMIEIAERINDQGLTQTQAAEVLVDKATGQVKVTRYVQAQDVGVAINPMAVEGQLDGGVVQGIGRALTEDMLFDPESGAVRNPSFATYLMPFSISGRSMANGIR